MDFDKDILGPDSVMSVLMLLSVFYTGWICWAPAFRRRGIRLRTTMLTFDILLSIGVVVLATITGDGNTQVVWSVLAVVSFIRLIYMRDSATKARKAELQAQRKTPPPPPESV